MTCAQASVGYWGLVTLGLPCPQSCPTPGVRKLGQRSTNSHYPWLRAHSRDVFAAPHENQAHYCSQRQPLNGGIHSHAVKVSAVCMGQWVLRGHRRVCHRGLEEPQLIPTLWTPWWSHFCFFLFFIMLYVGMYTGVHVYMFVYVYVCICICVCVWVCVCWCLSVCVCLCECVYIYIYIHHHTS